MLNKLKNILDKIRYNFLCKMHLVCTGIDARERLVTLIYPVICLLPDSEVGRLEENAAKQLGIDSKGVIFIPDFESSSSIGLSLYQLRFTIKAGSLFDFSFMEKYNSICSRIFERSLKLFTDIPSLDIPEIGYKMPENILDSESSYLRYMLVRNRIARKDIFERQEIELSEYFREIWQDDCEVFKYIEALISLKLKIIDLTEGKKTCVFSISTDEHNQDSWQAVILKQRIKEDAPGKTKPFP